MIDLFLIIVFSCSVVIADCICVEMNKYVDTFCNITNAYILVSGIHTHDIRYVTDAHWTGNTLIDY